MSDVPGGKCTLFNRTGAASDPLTWARKATIDKYMQKTAILFFAMLSVLATVGRARSEIVIDNITAGTFIDISGTGTALNLRDDGERNFNSGFLGTRVRIGNNGGVSINGSGNQAWANTSLPATANRTMGGNEYFSVFWDDLDSELGNVYVQDFADRLVIQWDNRPHYNGSGATDGVTFQAQIFGRESTIADGSILAQYLYTDTTFDDRPQFNNGASATIGYQTSPADAVIWSVNTPSVFGGTVLTLTSVPEPVSMLLFGMPATAYAIRRRR